jgi:hypothetical protein
MTSQRRIINRRTGQSRRVNAPIRRPREGGTVPDVLIAIALAAWTMAAIFLVASFLTDSHTAGDAGRDLERLFAGTLGIVGLSLFVLAVLLLGDDRGQGDHYYVPILIGAAVGGAEALCFLLPEPALLWAPPLLLIFALRPLRRGLGALFGMGGRR